MDRSTEKRRSLISLGQISRHQITTSYFRRCRHAGLSYSTCRVRVASSSNHFRPKGASSSPPRATDRKPTLRVSPAFSLPRLAPPTAIQTRMVRSEEHTSELQSQSNLVCRLLL